MRFTLCRVPVLLLACTAFLRSAGAENPAAPSVEQAVLAANAAMIAAANRLDLDTFFEAIIDSPQTSIVQNGLIFPSRADARAAVERGLRGVVRIDRRFTDPKVTVLSPGTALLVSEGAVTATLEDGRVMEGRFAVSLVFVLREGRWQVLHGHYSAPPASM